MISFDSTVDIPDTDKYEEHLRYNGYIVYKRDQMLKTLQYNEARANTLARKARDTMLFDSGGRYRVIGRDAIVGFLMNVYNVPESYFKKKGVEGYSLDAKKVLSKVLASNKATEFLKDYLENKSLKSKNGTANGITNRCRMSQGQNAYGDPVYKIPYSVNIQQNMRYNYRNEDVTAIPKDYNSCISIEDGYVMVWGDFAQSDFRIAYNLFIRSDENDKIFNKYEDKYEALARIVAKGRGVDFDFDAFKIQRPLYKQLTLATMYGTRGSAIKEENEFITMFYSFLCTCPRYIEFEKRCNQRAHLGLPISITSYFDHLEIVPLQVRTVDTINKVLNTPIQTGTSEIIILTVNKILERFYSIGYTPDDISIYYVRHDEPLFKMKKEVLKDAWIFEDSSSIQVDNWTPLKLDFSYGYVYKQPDLEIQEYVKTINERHKDDFTFCAPINNGREVYYPLDSVCTFETYVQVILDEKVTIMALYWEDKSVVQYYMIKSCQMNDIQTFIIQTVNGLLEDIYKQGYRGVLVNTQFMNTSDFHEATDTFIKYRERVDRDLLASKYLSIFMAKKYCSKAGIECTLQLPMEAKDLIAQTATSFKEVLK